MTTVRVALGISFVERYALIVLALLLYVLVARLLTPSEIGIYSVTAAVVGIAQVIREFGVGTYLIQEKNLSQERLETALGVSMVSGAAMFVAMMLAAPWVAYFFAD